MQEERERRQLHTKLFEEGKEQTLPNLHLHVPETSVYDEQPPVMYRKNMPLSQKTVTVFGYSTGNLDSVLRRFKEHGEIKDINHGRNWMDIEYKLDKSIYQALKDTGSIQNGEMIGVLQKNKKEVGYFNRHEKEQVFVKKEEGVVTKIFTYLFG
ncbi:hypothetical protein NECID01_0694 [Nematocida sp. AWRm77]|nr:hypothetical protein NECID01_0694 [Nematocida sp. AWRm77]